MMILRTILSFILLILFVTGSFAAKPFNVELRKVRDKKTIYELDYKLGDYSLDEVSRDGRTWTKINFGGRVVTRKEGFAELPFIHASLQLGPRDNMLISVADSEYTDYRLSYPLLPSKGVIYRDQNPENIPYEIAKNSVVDEWYPERIAQKSRPFILRDVRGANIYVYPFRYNAEKKILRVYKSVRIKVLRGRGIPVNPLEGKSATILPAMNNIYDSLFLNYNMTKDLYLGDLGKILVIYTSRDEDAIRPYIEWKRQKGFTVLKKQVSRGTNVKNIIKEAYQNDNDILYVQIVGDWGDIKSDTGPSSAPMDPMLGCVVGTDSYADVIIGRFSAQTPEHVTIQVDKTIKYEKNPDMNGTWYKKAIGIASGEGGSSTGDDGESDEAHMKNIRDHRLLESTYETVHEGYANSGVSSRNVGDWIDHGVGLINYVGHGSETSWATSGFSNRDIADLENAIKLPFIVSVACVNGKFHKSGGDSFAEAWLKKEGGGAVGAWMSTINQPWAPPMRGQDYFNDLLIGGYDYSQNPGNGTSVASGRTTYGSLAMNAACLMYAESNGSDDLKTIQTWTIFGDASLHVRSDKPQKINFSNDSVLAGVPFGTTVTGIDGPVSGAMVSLYQNGVGFTGVTDSSGKVTINHNLKVGKVKFTVTGFNLETKAMEIGVIPPDGPHVSLHEYSVSDDNNNQADYGETVGINVVLRNVGNDTSNNLMAKIVTDSEHVDAIVDGEQAVASIAPGKMVKLEDAFKVRFKRDIEDQMMVPFKLIVTDDAKKEYKSYFTIRVNAPKLSISGRIIGNSGVNPGETRSIRYVIKNTGHATTPELASNLAQIVSGLDINVHNPDKELGVIKAQSEKVVDYEVSFGNNVGYGTLANFSLEITGDEINKVYNHGVVVGMTDDFETGDFSGNNWTFEGNAEWSVVSENVYGGNYSVKSGEISRRQSSTMILELDFAKPGSISFYKRVSSEKKYDKLTFYIDGEKKGEWSGEVDWSNEFYTVTSGKHIMKWEYSKDYSADHGEDCAWLDDVLAVGLK
ncbi:MAG: hypothetical protein KAQ98_05220 [Bacteriovoracaceae bacterium]|nr:hypothetical protein [Bacteriovoracaceae bacterium]